MRLLSLGIVFTLLFSTYVLGAPTGEGGNQPPTESTSTAPEVPGSGSGGGADGGFNWDDIDTSHKGWGWINTGNQDKDLEQSKKRLSKLSHPAMILGSSKASGGQDLYYAPMTKGAAHHSDFVAGDSTNYLSGQQVGTKIHVGKPFKASPDEFAQKDPPNFTQTPEQEANYYRDAKDSAKNPRPSALESQTAEASTSGTDSQKQGGSRRGPSPSFRRQSRGGRSGSQSPTPSDPSNPYSQSGRGRSTGPGRRYGPPSFSRSPAPWRSRQRSPDNWRYRSQSPSRSYSPTGEHEAQGRRRRQ